MVKLILLKSYGLLSKGDEMTVTRGVAEQLIKREVARPAEEGEGERKGKRGRK